MSHLVVATRSEAGWSLDVRDVGTTKAAELSDVEAAVRVLLHQSGVADADTVDLQLLVPDFEVDLATQGVPPHPIRNIEVISGVITLIVLLGALAFLIGMIVN